MEWAITREEIKMRRRQLIPILATIFLGVAGFIAWEAGSMAAFWYSIAVVVILLVIFVVYNEAVQYKERHYSIGESGITISKGKRQKSWPWNELECFYKREDKALAQSMLVEEGRVSQIMGDTFLLKRKPASVWGKLRRTFIFVYAEPDSSQLVFKTLSKYLPQKQYSIVTEAGFPKYEFR